MCRGRTKFPYVYICLRKSSFPSFVLKRRERTRVPFAKFPFKSNECPLFPVKMDPLSLLVREFWIHENVPNNFRINLCRTFENVRTFPHPSMTKLSWLSRLVCVDNLMRISLGPQAAQMNTFHSFVDDCTRKAWNIVATKRKKKY